MLPENCHTESQPYLSGFPAQHDPDVPLSDTEEKENTTHLLSAVQAYRCQGFRQSEILPAVPSLLPEVPHVPGHPCITPALRYESAHRFYILPP